MGGIFAAQGNYIISGNVVHDNAGEGVLTGDGEDGLVSNNVVYGNRDSGIDVEYAEVRGNVVYKNHDGIIQFPEYFDRGFSAAADEIDDNRVFGNLNVGIRALAGSEVAGNDVYSNGIGIQGADLSYSDSGYGPGTPFSGKVNNNLVYSNSNVGILISGAQGGLVANNTVFQPLGDGLQVKTSVGGAGSLNVSLLNNIIWAQSGYDIFVSDDSQNGFQSAYNILETSGRALVGHFQFDFDNLRDWQFEAGLDTHSESADPKFVNPAGADGVLGFDSGTGIDGGQDDNFHLQNGSPGIAAGDPTSDYSQQPSPAGGRINLGAFGGTPEATTTAGVGVFVTQSGGSTEVSVGGTADSYTISLSSPPTSDVTVTLGHDNTLTLSRSVLTFTPSNWNVAQTVTAKQITAPGETGDYHVNITQTITSADSRYNGLSVPNVVVKVDNGGATIANPLPATLTLSGLTFTYDGTSHAATVTTNPVGIAGVTITYMLGGVAIANPTQAGSYTVIGTLSNPNYQASPVTGTLTIAKATPVVTWAAIASITYGTPLSSTQLDAVASVAGTFRYSPPAGTTLGVGTAQVLLVTFSPTDPVDFQQVMWTNTIDVRAGSPTTAIIQFARASFSANITDGTAKVVLRRTGESASTVSVVLSSPGGPGIAAFQRTIVIGSNETSATVAIPLTNDGRAGEGDADIPLSISTAGTGAAWVRR